MANELQHMYQHEGELNALIWERKKKSGPDLMEINLDIEGQKQQMESSRSAFYGMLSKASRNFEEMIEEHLTTTLAPFREIIAEEMLSRAKKRYNQ